MDIFDTNTDDLTASQIDVVGKAVAVVQLIPKKPVTSSPFAAFNFGKQSGLSWILANFPEAFCG